MKVYEVNGYIALVVDDRYILLQDSDFDNAGLSGFERLVSQKATLVYDQIKMNVGGKYALRDVKPNDKMVILDSVGVAFQYSERDKTWIYDSRSVALYEEETVTIIHMGVDSTQPTPF